MQTFIQRNTISTPLACNISTNAAKQTFGYDLEYPTYPCNGSLTLNNCTPTTANINCNKYVTSIMFPIVLIATITHFTTYYGIRVIGRTPIHYQLPKVYARFQ